MHDRDQDRCGRSVAAYDANASAYRVWAAALSMQAQLQRFAAMARPGGIVLDAGCGTGRDLQALSAAGFRAVGMDLSAGMLAEAAAASTPLVRSDLRRLGFASATFDGVWACASLVHLDAVAMAAALSELARVVRPQAPLYVTVKAGADDEGWADSPHGRRWYHYWSSGALHGAVEEAGLTVAGEDRSSPAWLGLYLRPS